MTGPERATVGRERPEGRLLDEIAVVEERAEDVFVTRA